jgi:arylsulfatase A-like enzyme
MAMLHHLDLGVGRVVDTLKQEGVWENTLLVLPHRQRRLARR